MQAEENSHGQDVEEHGDAKPGKVVALGGAYVSSHAAVVGKEEGGDVGGAEEEVFREVVAEER